MTDDAWEILVPTHAGAGTPHLAALLASNPCARVHVVHLGKEEPAGAPAWRGNDAALRAWWRENRGKITGRRVAWLEYDVLVTQELPDVWPEGVLAKELKGRAGGGGASVSGCRNSGGIGAAWLRWG
jgi:hypothetical protein